MLLIINKKTGTFGLQAGSLGRSEELSDAFVTTMRPRLPSIPRRIPFQEWKDTYRKQLDHIAFVYETQIAQTGIADHSTYLNISKFNELLMRKLYETSTCSYRDFV
jgi:hypothetical protein